MNDLSLFQKRIISLKEKNFPTLLRFQTAEACEQIRKMVGKTGFVYTSGGYENAEYQRVIISPYELTDPSFEIIIFEIVYNSLYLKPNHRMILGNLMALGITRDVIGDIIITCDRCFFMAVANLEKYFIDELSSINNVPISLTKVTTIPEYQGDIYLTKTVFLASLRLDCVIAGAYGMSRNMANEIISKELVQVNHQICSRNSTILATCDLISIRGKGRVKVLSISDNLTKSNRIRINLGLK